MPRIKFFTKAGWKSISLVKLMFGPIMWRCTDSLRSPHYRREWSIIAGAQRNCIQGRWLLGCELNMWRRRVVASNDDLGTEYHTVGFTLHLLTWEVDISLGLKNNNRVGTGKLAP